MPISSGVVGAAVGERTVQVTARATMAYAAGTDDLNARYMDDARVGGVVAPPMFAVTLDWQLRRALLDALALAPEESVRGVHATQDMTFHRPIRPGDTLTTRGTVVQLEARPPGAYLVARYDTTDGDSAPVCTVYYGMIFRGVGVSGPERTLDAPPPLPARPEGRSPIWRLPLVVAPQAPHVYSACAGIYNPIHTERAVALAVGLPDIVIHGTLTLAYAARELLDRDAGGDPAAVARLACRFSGMVLPGTTINVSLDT